MLTKIQKKVVESHSFPYFLRAGAGTGKTEVLVQKVCRILTEERESLSHFAIITFTNKAADEMRERIAKTLWEKGQCTADAKKAQWCYDQYALAHMAQISTIHSFCSALLRQFGMAQGIAPNFKIRSSYWATKATVEEVVSQNSEKEMLLKVPNYKLVSLITEFLEHISAKGISISAVYTVMREMEVEKGNEVHTPVHNMKYQFLLLCTEAYESIRLKKRSDGILSIGDLIYEAAELLSNPAVAALVSKEYQYIFIDEFQDVDAVQFQMIMALLHAGSKLFMVGDEKQSIFRFRGADIQNMRRMEQRLEESQHKVTEMQHNFRTDQALVDIINMIFQHVYTHEGNALQFPRQRLKSPRERKLSYAELPYENRYAEHIVDVIMHLQEETLHHIPLCLHDIAILCRRNSEVAAVAHMLHEAQIPASILGGTGLYRQKEIIDTYRLFQALCYNAWEYQEEILFTDYYQALLCYNKERNLSRYLQQMRQLLDEDSIRAALCFAYEQFSLSRYYECNMRRDALKHLQQLLEIVSELECEAALHPIDFLHMLEYNIQTEKETTKSDEKECETAGVTVCTIHKAKGRAFPVVVIPYCDRPLLQHRDKSSVLLYPEDNSFQFAMDMNRLFPKQTIEDPLYEILQERAQIAHLEEELRILYVALTRAKHKVIALSSKSRKHVLASKQPSFAKWLAPIL